MTNEPAVVSTTACLLDICATVRGVVNRAAGTAGLRCACADDRAVSADSSRAARCIRSIIGRMRNVPLKGGSYRSLRKSVVSAFRRNPLFVVQRLHRVQAGGTNGRIQAENDADRHRNAK